MTDFNASDRDVNRAIRSWLHENRHEDVSRVAGAVLDQVDTIPQRRAKWWPAWRTPVMNKIVSFGLATAAVVLIAIVAINLLPGSGVESGGEPSAEPTPTPEPSVVEPTSTAEAFLPEGPFAWFDPTIAFEPRTDLPSITVTIPASGWSCPGYAACTLGKGDEYYGDDTAPESAMITTSTTAGILVYEDPCQWEYNVPHPPATTADDIAAALAAQPSRDASDPVDVTVGGYPGKVITLHVPDDLGYTDAGLFSDCFRGVYASYTLGDHDATGTVPTRSHQEPGQIDTFWIVEVDGAIVIIDAMYRADTPAERIEEMRAIAESATFE